EEIDVRVEVETEPDEDDDEGDEGDEGAEAAADRDAGATAASDRTGEGDAEPTDEGSGTPSRRRRVLIPDDPTVLSHLLAGIPQIEQPRRQAMLELGTTEERLLTLLGLIDREILLLRRRLRAFIPDARVLGPRRS
ncbi:MAG TPA: hypothetical protein VFY18_13465, partial [Candidatus Limnocylindrales bacterium]|nr:hypothetical protein [Candidatus Limnocylindrales bacterium]